MSNVRTNDPPSMAVSDTRLNEGSSEVRNSL